MKDENTLKDKKVLLGISGGIAAYKSAELVRQLKKVGACVRVAMTESAKSFITPLTLQTLSGHAVKDSLFSLESEAEIDHIALARWADYVLIAPATANFLAKLSLGLADDLLSTLCLAVEAPLLVAPAMNRAMWAHPATQSHVATLESRGVQICGPDSGEQACGEVGEGRMLPPEGLVSLLQMNVASTESLSLSNYKVMVTAGPTREAIDPVRYLSNHSSGKMGYAIAEQFAALGAQVTLVSGHTQLSCPDKVHRIEITSAGEMADAVLSQVVEYDIFVAAAAVADFTLSMPSMQKLKKLPGQETMQLELVRTPDILAEVASLQDKPFTVGFAAETENLLENAELKRRRKGVDMICANAVGRQDIGFNVDENEITVLSAKESLFLAKSHKQQLAQELVRVIFKQFRVC